MSETSCDYSYLFDSFSEEEIRSKAESVYKSLSAFIKHDEKLRKGVYIHEGKLESLIAAYFADIDRIKRFHQIKHENSAKRTAYTAFWILRGAPLQITNNDITYRFVNEMFAVSIIINECFKSYSGNMSDEQRKVLSNFSDEMLYHFKYRHYHPRTIELALDMFRFGTSFNNIPK